MLTEQGSYVKSHLTPIHLTPRLADGRIAQRFALQLIEAEQLKNNVATQSVRTVSSPSPGGYAFPLVMK